MNHVVVIGGGAAGLAAAIGAVRGPAQVTLLERGHQLGRKVLASGGGRCNLSHERLAPERYHGAKPAFLREVLSPFDAERFFSELGLLTAVEPDGRVFPRCGKAQAVLDVLKAELDRLSVTVLLGTQAVSLQRQDHGFLVKTAAVPWKKDGPAPHPQAGQDIRCDRVILACGSPAYPQLGAGEAAYELAKALGHRVHAPRPSLVPLLVKENALKRLHGLRVQAGLTVFCGGREAAKSQGEVLFTDYGISGPATLDVSRAAVRGLAQGPVQGSLDLFPELSGAQLSAMLSARWGSRPKRLLKDLFLGMFTAQLSGAIMDSLGWDAHRPLDSLGHDGVQRLAERLKDWRFEVTGNRPWSEAMVAAGGVDPDEVDPRTLESHKVPGLHLAGEMLDVDGDSGGFNLHFAWASGMAAGRAAARRGS